MTSREAKAAQTGAAVWFDEDIATCWREESHPWPAAAAAEDGAAAAVAGDDAAAAAAGDDAAAAAAGDDAAAAAPAAAGGAAGYIAVVHFQADGRRLLPVWGWGTQRRAPQLQAWQRGRLRKGSGSRQPLEQGQAKERRMG